MGRATGWLRDAMTAALVCLLVGFPGRLALAEVKTVKVIEDFEGAGTKGLWERTGDAATGAGAGVTSNVFRNWGGFALNVAGIPEGADGVSFWARTDDGTTAGIKLAIFEARTVDGQLRQTEAWGKPFWVTPSWQKFTFPLKRLGRIWAWRADGKLQSEHVKTVQFMRSYWSPGAMASRKVVFDQVAFVAGATRVSIERQAGRYALAVDAGKPVGTTRRFWRALSPGPSGEQNTDMQGGAGKAMRLIGKEKTFDVVRVGWHVRRKKSAYVPYRYGKCFYTEDADGTPVYQWDDQDKLLDAMVKELHLTPMILMGCLPNELGQRVVHGKAMNGPPKDWGKWGDLVRTFVKHYVDRSGREEVATWYWEVWNEPDLWWHNWFDHDENGKKRTAGYEAFFKLYDIAAGAITEVLPNANVGAPAVAGFPRDYPMRLLRHCVSGKNYVTGETGSPLQYLSYHDYGTAYHQLEKLFEAQAALSKFAKGRPIELQVTEYASAIFGQANSKRYQAGSLCKSIDGYLYAAAGAAKIRWLHWFGLVREFDTDGAGYFTKRWKSGKYQVTTLFLSVKRGESPGVLMAKPVYNAYRMLSHLDTNLLRVSGSQFGDPVHAIATRSDDGKRVSVLVYNHDALDHDCAAPSQDINLTVSNLPFAGRARLTSYRIDPDHSDVFSEWEKLGAPARADITDAQIRQIKLRENLEMAHPAKVLTMAKGKSWSTSLQLAPHSIALFVFTAEGAFRDSDNGSKGDGA